jgi:tripartite-type tricarboxylate transporter receptor subunit TctC
MAPLTRRTLLLAGTAFAAGPAFAQETYPSRRIEIIVPFPRAARPTSSRA